jgi:hypothetical protein
MKQLSLRGFDEELLERIRNVARNRGISLNKATILLLRRGAGLQENRNAAAVVGDSLDHLIGKWSEEEEKELLETIRHLDCCAGHGDRGGDYRF